MNKVIHLSLARKSVPILMDVVQSATAPSIEFVLDDYTPPTNARARIYIKKDGGEVYNNCTLSGNVVTYTPTAGSFDVAGQCVAQLELVQGSTVAVSWRIFVTVEPNLINGSAAPASSEYNALTQLIVNAQRYDGAIGANNITGYNNRQGWIALTSGQDLDTVTAPGVYYSPTSAIASSIANCPTKGRFKLVVEILAGNSNSYVKQTINGLVSSNQSMVWTRDSDNGFTNWSAWELLPMRAEVDAIANRGAKNILPNTAPTQTVSGVVFTHNADGSITANGTATANAYYKFGTIDIPAGKYILSGCPEGGSEQGYILYVSNAPSGFGNWTDYGDGQRKTLSRGFENVSFYIRVMSGVTVNNLTFYPMIRDASIQDDTYVPYGMSNAELTDKVSVKTKVVEGTTASDGSLGLGLNQEYSVIAVDLGGGGKWGLPFLYNRAWHVRCLNNVATYQVLASTAVTATVYYFDK